MKKPRIVLLSWEYYPMFAGGLGLMAKEVVEELRDQGVDVTVLVPQIPKGYDLPEYVVSLQKPIKDFYKKNLPIPNLDFNIDTFRPSNRKPGNVWPRLFTSHKKTKTKTTSLYPNNTPAISRAYAHAALDYLKKNQEFDLVIGVDWEAIPSFHLFKEHLTQPFVFYIHATEMDRSPDKMGTNSRILYEMELNAYKATSRYFWSRRAKGYCGV
jgi:glycogen synthase